MSEVSFEFQFYEVFTNEEDVLIKILISVKIHMRLCNDFDTNMHEFQFC